MNDFKIRKMMKKDLEKLAKVNLKAFAPYSKKRMSFKKVLGLVKDAYSNAIKDACFVITIDERIVGYIISTKKSKTKAHIPTLCVVPEFQRSKIGER